MSKQDMIQTNGVVTDTLPGDFFKVDLEDGRQLTIKISGRLRKNKIRITTGDKVVVDQSPYDANNGMISRRL